MKKTKEQIIDVLNKIFQEYGKPRVGIPASSDEALVDHLYHDLTTYQKYSYYEHLPTKISSQEAEELHDILMPLIKIFKMDKESICRQSGVTWTTLTSFMNEKKIVSRIVYVKLLMLVDFFKERVHESTNLMLSIDKKLSGKL